MQGTEQMALLYVTDIFFPAQIGVAVGDIDAVQKKAYLTRLGIQVGLKS